MDALLNRPGFPDLCDQWKKDKGGDGTYKHYLKMPVLHSSNLSVNRQCTQNVQKIY